MMSKLARKRVVAEVSKNWTDQETDRFEGLISEKFEALIVGQMNRGYELESWQYQATPGKALCETIVAVFVELNPDPRQGL